MNYKAGSTAFNRLQWCWRTSPACHPGGHPGTCSYTPSQCHHHLCWQGVGETWIYGSMTTYFVLVVWRRRWFFTLQWLKALTSSLYSPSPSLLIHVMTSLLSEYSEWHTKSEKKHLTSTKKNLPIKKNWDTKWELPLWLFPPNPLFISYIAA